MSQRRYGILALVLLLFCVLLYQAASVELPDIASEKCSGWRLSAHLQERSEALIQAGRELQPILTQGRMRSGCCEGCVCCWILHIYFCFWSGSVRRSEEGADRTAAAKNRN